MRKKVDSRIRTLVERCVALRHRSLFVIVGDKGRDQVVNLHYMLTKTAVKARPSVLWCYKKELYMSSHKKKRMQQIKKLMQRGLLDPEQEDPFSLFVASTNIRYCYYSDTHKVLGNTFGMCVLQDFEALTPNLLARTIETVEGGGIVVMLLSTLRSLRELFSLTMDVHSRLRTESHQQVTGRFNERLVLSLASNPACILMDDELNILPTSSHVANIKPLPRDDDGAPILPAAGTQAKAELADLIASLSDTQPVGPLVARCRTLDQARAVVTFLDAASEKTLRSTVALTATRGRGKSAALGLAIAGALALGYANIFVTAPSPENLRTLFEFVFKGLDAMDYKEHIDYDLVESTNPAFGRAVVRVNVFRNHRQTVQYIQPQHHARLAQAELLVIDEAAAIPLPLVRAMLGPYLVFLCSTVNGYEGTGRSLSLKLISQLRDESAKLAGGKKAASAAPSEGGASLARTFREVRLQEPIRYAAGDDVEAWLHELLCLDAANHVPRAPARLPHPDECDLFYVSRDTLFSYHRASEAFLQRMMALCVASHYRNTPNDLILMSDAPAHHLFVLLGPVDETQNALPDVLAVVQVALEGAISRAAALTSLAQGNLPAGDLIPWTLGQQFQDPEFPRLSGARVVRIAVHPDLQRAGYGSRALELLRRYYEGDLADVVGNAADSDDEDGQDEDEDTPAASAARHVNGTSNGARRAGGDAEAKPLQEEVIAPRGGLPPLLVNLADRRPEALQYLGASFGVTAPLLGFWQRAGYLPVYLRQTPSDVTGEHTCVVLRPLRSPEVEGTAWLAPFYRDFRLRFMSLLPGAFRSFSPALSLSLLSPKLSWSEDETKAGVQRGFTVTHPDGTGFTPYDLKRLQAYSNNLVDHHLILDLLPGLAAAFFAGHLPASMSLAQAAILLAMGLQRAEVKDAEAALQLPPNQVLALFNKAVRKLYDHLRAVKEASVGRTLPVAAAQPRIAAPQAESLDLELDDAAQAVRQEMMARLDPADLEQYRIRGGDAEFEEALTSGAAPKSGGRVSVKAVGGSEAGASGREADDDAADGADDGKNGGAAKKKRKGGEGGGMLYQKNAKRKQGKSGKRRSGGSGGHADGT